MFDGKLSLPEAIAALGVILSLLFVGFEVRQSNQIARQEAINELANTMHDIIMAVAESEYLAGIVMKIVDGESASEFETAEVGSGYMYLLNSHLFNNRIDDLIKLGFVEQQDFAFPDEDDDLYSSRFAREMWLSQRKYLDEDFAEFWENRFGYLEPPADQ